MSKALRARGFRFVGPTICYAFMQAVGMVNDHLDVLRALRIDRFEQSRVSAFGQPAVAQRLDDVVRRRKPSEHAQLDGFRTMRAASDDRAVRIAALFTPDSIALVTSTTRSTTGPRSRASLSSVCAIRYMCAIAWVG